MTDLFAASNALKGTVTLTADEADALQGLLAMLATMETRGFGMYPEHPGCIIVTRELWRDMVLRYGQRLMRVMPKNALPSPR